MVYCGRVKRLPFQSHTLKTLGSTPMFRTHFMRPLAILYIDDKHKEFVKFCNSLRCPLCSAQLDGAIHKKKANLYCVNDNNEYKTIYVPDVPEPTYELITYTYTQYQYVIEYCGNPSLTIINRYNMDASPLYRNSTKQEVFKCNGRLTFFRKRLEENVFLNKLKTYQVFS